MALPRFPQDVLSTIVDAGSFSKQELCTIALASPHFRYEAQRKLFRDPGQHCINVGTNANDLVTASSFLTAVISSPDRLALMVRRYHVTLSWYDFVSPKSPTKTDEQRNMQNTGFNRLSRGLPLMTKLTELQFYTNRKYQGGPVHSRPPSITMILKRCIFRLEVFRCSYVDTGHNDRKRVRAFLHNQPHIQELWIREVGASVNTDARALENLEAFQDVCPAAVSVGGRTAIIIGMLQAGRPLKHICWEEYWPSWGDNFLDTAHFSTVELMESFGPGPKLSLVCAAFPNLILYKVDCHTGVFESPEMLRNLPRLSVLLIVFHSCLVHLFVRFTQREEALIKRLFSSSLSLQYIEVHNHEGGRQYVIDRATQVITVYVPVDIPLHTGERKEVLHQRVTLNVAPNDVFLRTFPL